METLFGELGAAAAAVAERVQASVVQVRSPGGTGAGTIWRADGMVVTNHHVLRHERGEVRLADGRRLDAVAVARDPRNDLAVLRVEADGLPAAAIGDAGALRAGELVLAVGHPYGVVGALTVGVVSRALERRGAGRAGARELLEADILLGPGNSGGPLVDARGRVVGINAMVAGGMALAVPSHLVQRLLGHQAGPAVLGIGGEEVAVPPALAARAGLATRYGVVVTQVAPGSAAEEAGLLFGDVLLGLGGAPLTGGAGLVDALAEYAGGPLRLTVLRGGVARTVLAFPRRNEGPAGAGHVPADARVPAAAAA